LPQDWVSASEIGAYAYCARAYWLDRVQRDDLVTGNAQRLESGRAQHLAHGRRVSLQRWLVWAAISAIVVAAGLVWIAIGQ